MDFDNYIMDSEERLKLLTIYIAVSQERVTLETLMKLTEVSRNTVLSDLRSIRNDVSMEKYGMLLVSEKSRGYFFKCSPLNKIQYLYQLLKRVFRESSESFLVIFKEKIKLFQEGSIFIEDDFSLFLNTEMHNISSYLGKKVNDKEMKFIIQTLPYFFLSCRNMSLSTQEQEELENKFALIRERLEYRVSRKLYQSLLRKFNFVSNENEIYLLALVLISCRKDSDIHVSSADFEHLRSIMVKFISKFEVSQSINIDNKEDLLKNLLIHYKSLLFRKTYGLVSYNPLTKQIKEEYKDLFMAVKSCITILEEYSHILLNDDEVAYITIHIGGFVRNSISKYNHKRLILICDDGIAAQSILAKQLETHYPDNEVTSIFTTEQFKKVEDSLEIDLVVTTNRNLETRFPTITVPIILTQEDTINLSGFIKSKNTKELFSVKLEILLKQFIRDSSYIRDLQLEIEKLISESLL